MALRSRPPASVSRGEGGSVVNAIKEICRPGGWKWHDEAILCPVNRVLLNYASFIVLSNGYSYLQYSCTQRLNYVSFIMLSNGYIYILNHSFGISLEITWCEPTKPPLNWELFQTPDSSKRLFFLLLSLSRGGTSGLLAGGPEVFR